MIVGADPHISVLCPVWNPEPEYLRECIESVIAQRYGRWELCLVDDGSTSSEVVALLDEYASAERISVRHIPHQGISRAQNEALAMATGEFVAFLDHDDVLEEDALVEVAAVLRDEPALDVVFTDEILCHRGRPPTVFHKPDQVSLDQPWLNHLAVYRRLLVVDLGGLREDFELAQDWDLLVRVMMCTQRIRHISKPLYRWRRSGATAGVRADAHSWRRRCIEEHAHRLYGPDASIRDALPFGFLHVLRPVLGNPLVSVLLPTAGVRRRMRGRAVTLVVNCVESILAKTDYENFEVLCHVDAHAEERVRRELAHVRDPRVRIVSYPAPFNYARKINVAALRAEGDHLLLLNDDTEVISGEWMRALLELSQEHDVGVVGAKLRFADGSIEHAGIRFMDGMPRHYMEGVSARHPGHNGDLFIVRDCAAVTGACVMTRTELFLALGGLSTRLSVDYNDIDYCLKARARGYRVVWTPRAELFHVRCASRPRTTPEEASAFRAFWGSPPDPFLRIEMERAQSFLAESAVLGPAELLTTPRPWPSARPSIPGDPDAL